jgi:protein gp37
VTEVRDQCAAAGVPFFFKQWGSVQKKRAGRTLMAIALLTFGYFRCRIHNIYHEA